MRAIWGRVELGGLFDRVGHRGRARAYYLDALRYGRSSVARAPSLENQKPVRQSIRVPEPDQPLT